MFDQEPIIGIDLGTTNSVVAIMEGDDPVVIPNVEGGLKTPSVVTFEPDGEVIVGEIARRQAATKPERTITSAKRLMGHYYSELDAASARHSYKLQANANDEIEIQVGNRAYRPQEISAEILKKLKHDAEQYLQRDVTQAIITVPAYFDDRQRNATKEAGSLAGLEVLRLVNEPTAAAMAYGMAKGKGGLVAVYDFGGGTFDLTVLDISERTFEVLVTEGDSHLGGDDIDSVLVQKIVDDFYEQHRIDLTENPATLLRLREACEKVKCELSSVRQATISLPFLTQIDNEPVHYERQLSRTEFEDMIEHLIERSIDICSSALDSARIKKEKIKRVILVGGTTRVPLVGQLVEEFFEQAPFRGVNPDEIVAMGAAVQAGVLAGNLDEVVLLDVTPHSVGIETREDGYSKIVERNTTIPIKSAKTFTTTETNQEFVNVHVLQGEERHASDNLSLGNFMLKGIEPASAGHPRIRVTFQINADGILEITAQDLASGSEQALTISHAYLSEEERKARDLAHRRRTRTERKANRKDRRRSLRGAGESDSDARPQIGIVSPSKSEAGVAAPSGAPDESPKGGQISTTFEVVDDSGATDAPRAPARPAKRETDKKPAEQPLPLPSSTAEVSGEIIAPDYDPSVGGTGTMGPTPPRDLAKTLDEDVDEPAGLDPARSTPSGVISAFDPTEWIGEVEGDESAAPEPVLRSRSSSENEIAIEVTLCPDGEIGDALRAAFALLEEGKDDAEAQEAYRKVIDRLEQLAEVYPADPKLLSRLAHMYALQGEAEKCSERVERMLSTPGVSPADIDESLQTLIEILPSHSGLRRKRAAFLQHQGEFAAAIKELERILTSESGDLELLGQLETAYIAMLDKSYSASQELKLVKILLRQNKLDEAITRLQTVIEDPHYRARAQKVLGFCYWQKQMYYPAYQQFKSLTLSEELKDILGRLAGDLESTGDSLRSLEVLEFLAEKDPGNEQIEVRMANLRAQNAGNVGAPSSTSIPEPALGGSAKPSAHEALRGSRFIILEELNRGSMGVVYKARDTALDEIVALKVLNDFLGTDPMAIERFKREARAAKRLTHPRIVRINDLFEIGEKKLISMEYIDGYDLKKLMLKQKTVRGEQFKSIILQLCEGLVYAHQRGVVHRDIKPANIMLTSKTEEVKITDLGIAKNLQSEDMTTGSRILGTPLYMAPEQIEGKGVDARTDIYALGIMMYEMVNGIPPFCEGNIEYQHIHSEPPPLASDVDPALGEIILKMVAKKKEDRFANVTELTDAISET